MQWPVLISGFDGVNPLPVWSCGRLLPQRPSKPHAPIASACAFTALTCVLPRREHHPREGGATERTSIQRPIAGQPTFQPPRYQQIPVAAARNPRPTGPSPLQSSHSPPAVVCTAQTKLFKTCFAETDTWNAATAMNTSAEPIITFVSSLMSLSSVPRLPSSGAASPSAARDMCGGCPRIALG